MNKDSDNINSKTNLNSIRFHHFGLALNDFSRALAYYRNLRYDCTPPIIEPQHNVEVVFCYSEQYPSVELVKPINEKSPVVNYLKNNNEIIYHTCYELDDVERDIKVLFSNNKAICVEKPKPSIAFDGRLASFYLVNNVGLIEILQGESRVSSV